MVRFQILLRPQMEKIVTTGEAQLHLINLKRAPGFLKTIGGDVYEYYSYLYSLVCLSFGLSADYIMGDRISTGLRVHSTGKMDYLFDRA